MIRLPGRTAPAFAFGPAGQLPSALAPARTAARNELRSRAPRDECRARITPVSADALGAAPPAALPLSALTTAGADAGRVPATDESAASEGGTSPAAAGSDESAAGASAQARAAARATSGARLTTERD